MFTRRLVAVVMIAVGVVVLAYSGIVFRTPGKPLDVGPVHERDLTGQHLRDDIAQLLLAIQLRLLALDGAIQTNNTNLKMVIAETQRIMKDSLGTIHRIAPVTKGRHHEA